MNQSKISGLVEKISNKLRNEQLHDLSKIELDLVMQHLRELYDELDAAKSAGKISVPQEKVKPAKTNLHNIQPEELIVHQKFSPNEHLLLGDFTEKQLQQTETIKVERKTAHVENKAGVSPPPPVTIVKQVEKTASINESIQHPGSLNEKLKSSSSTEVHKKLASKPLKDLIDLNHRFMLLNDLFKGNAEAFSTAIHHIDQLSDFNAASNFIQTQLAANYFWDENANSTHLFTRLVKQKFGVE